MILIDVNLLRWSLPLLCLLSWTVHNAIALERGESCVNPDGKPGKCILFVDCPSFDRFIGQPLTPKDVLFMIRSRCDTSPMGYQIQLVCCADSSATLPEPPNCGVQQSNRVSDDQTTRINEFPWTALLEVQTGDETNGYNCGGALINNRYVLTTARCITSLPPGWRVYRVRLGEWDQDSDIDCVDGLCNKAPVDVEIEKIIVHNGYSPKDTNRHNDIALIRLARQIEYSSSIRPICLPLSSSANSREDAIMYSAGWRMTAQKQKTELSIVDEKNCTKIHQRNGVSLQSSQMCTSAVRMNDTCCGDLGGPLMQQQGSSWYMYGMASLIYCGKNGVPDVYTNVTQYVDWIRDNIE